MIMSRNRCYHPMPLTPCATSAPMAILLPSSACLVAPASRDARLPRHVSCCYREYPSSSRDRLVTYAPAVNFTHFPHEFIGHNGHKNGHRVCKVKPRGLARPMDPAAPTRGNDPPASVASAITPFLTHGQGSCSVPPLGAVVGPCQDRPVHLDERRQRIDEDDLPDPDGLPAVRVGLGQPEGLLPVIGDAAAAPCFPGEHRARTGTGGSLERQVTNWRKSSASANGGEQCVEVGTGQDAAFIRDTANRDGFTLSVPAAAWRAFTARVRAR